MAANEEIKMLASKEESHYSDSSSACSTLSNSIEESGGINSSRQGRFNPNLRKAIAHAAERVSTIKPDVMKSTFPEIYKLDKSITKIGAQLSAQLKASFLEQVELESNSKHLFESLEDLESAINLSNEEIGTKKREKVTWRPSESPQEDIRDHLYHYKKQQKKCFEFTYQTLIVENKNLQNTLDSNHEEILALKAKIVKQQQEILNSISICGSPSLQL